MLHAQKNYPRITPTHFTVANIYASHTYLCEFEAKIQCMFMITYNPIYEYN